ncbi:acyl-CoA dehydrogenase family protein [Piscinibacter sp.]|uniref:acyl-CoA dehydrogenase family protein n=1 Tax=Piscinibacter sp. TaxID=1903157 RepID=UPI003783FE09
MLELAQHRVDAVAADQRIVAVAAVYRVAAAARVAATDAFSLAAQENIQTHGGMGVTWETDCHLFYRRARQYAVMLGSVHEWRERLVVALASQLDMENSA